MTNKYIIVSRNEVFIEWVQKNIKGFSEATVIDEASVEAITGKIVALENDKISLSLAAMADTICVPQAHTTLQYKIFEV